MRHTEIQREKLAYQKQLTNIDPSWPVSIRKGLKYIHDNLFDESLNVAQIKEKCHINGKSFASRFRICIGFYPKEYILNHRITFGKQLLTKREMPIAQIGLLLGFSSHSAFCKAFKNRVGIPPSLWLVE